MHCPELIPEPTAANSVLGITDGVIVDIGGGTTGIAIFEDGRVVYTADEATGGTHISLVIAVADMSFEAAEAQKKDPCTAISAFPDCPPRDGERWARSSKNTSGVTMHNRSPWLAGQVSSRGSMA
jgi:ethanolamine utilization protein EutJ